MISWVFPIAGLGTRSSSLGEYKPFVEVFENCSILNIFLSGIREIINSNDRMVFITTEFYEKNHDVESSIRNLLKQMDLKNKVDVIILPHTPKGQALTVKEGVEKLDDSFLKERVFVINSDQMVFFDLSKVNMNRCGVGVYFNEEPSSCFYDLDLSSNSVRGIREKEMISAYASSGIFYFTSGQRLLNCIEWGIENGKQYKEELYLGPCMEALDQISYFKTLMKFDLGNAASIELFRKFGQHLIWARDRT